MGTGIFLALPSRSMKWLGPILLVGVFLRHNTSLWMPGYSSQAWFYILGGLYEILLSAVLMIFLRHPLALAALWIGILEGAQISTCRLLTTDMSHYRIAHRRDDDRALPRHRVLGDREGVEEE